MVAGAHQGSWPPEATGAWLQDCQFIIQENAPDSRENTPIHFLTIVLQPQNAVFAQIRIHSLLGTGSHLFAPVHRRTSPALQLSGLLLSPLITFGAFPSLFVHLPCPIWNVPHLFSSHVNATHPSWSHQVFIPTPQPPPHFNMCVHARARACIRQTKRERENCIIMYFIYNDNRNLVQRLSHFLIYYLCYLKQVT